MTEIYNCVFFVFVFSVSLGKHFSVGEQCSPQTIYRDTPAIYPSEVGGEEMRGERGKHPG